jgi:hypothetical protein
MFLQLICENCKQILLEKEAEKNKKYEKFPITDDEAASLDKVHRGHNCHVELVEKSTEPTVEIKYVEDGNIQSVVINPWSSTLFHGEALLWDKVFKIGIIRKKVFSTNVVTNFRIMTIDEHNRVMTCYLVSSVDDIIVMNTRRESESMGYGFYAGRYAGMAGPHFSSGTSKTVGSIVFVINGQKVEWVEIPDPTGLKNFIKSIIKTMYEPLTKLETKSSGAGIPCPSCGLQNPKSSKFCNNCGKNLASVCSKCGTSNPLNSSFCSECGFSLQ